jgi:pimeloyl-ACP methyl ester carboxylesterase
LINAIGVVVKNSSFGVLIAAILAQTLAVAHSAEPRLQSGNAKPAALPKTWQAGPCTPGIFRFDRTAYVVLTKAEKGFGYAFSNGIVGNTGDSDARVACGHGAVMVDNTIWTGVPVVSSNTRFASRGVVLAGRLMEPAGGGKKPLVVFAHGSEENGWIDRAPDPYHMVARGLSVFVYDKRGTGMSMGEYTQNFPVLADDLVAASRAAKRLAQGRFNRFGLFGVSQGGWIAPLAANRVNAQFLGIGYGLAVDIAEQDAEKVSKQLQDSGYGADVLARARTLTDITERIVKSGIKEGLDELAAFQNDYRSAPWYALIQGNYSGMILSVPAADLRKNGIAHLEKLGVDWTHVPVDVLKQIAVPQLWALAGEDRQAPIAQTMARLANLRAQGGRITIYVFPDTGHGMWHSAVKDDPSQQGKVADGYHALLADWAKGKLASQYGKAVRN